MGVNIGMTGGILAAKNAKGEKNKLTTEGTKGTKFKILSVTNSSLCSMCPLRLNFFFPGALCAFARER